MPKPNPYQVLGINHNASQDEIKKNYRKLALAFHPDKNPAGEEQFKKIQAAYELIKTPEKRASYDKEAAYAQSRPSFNPRPKPQASPFDEPSAYSRPVQPRANPNHGSAFCFYRFYQPPVANYYVFSSLQAARAFQLPAARVTGIPTFSYVSSTPLDLFFTMAMRSSGREGVMHHHQPRNGRPEHVFIRTSPLHMEKIIAQLALNNILLELFKDREPSQSRVRIPSF